MKSKLEKQLQEALNVGGWVLNEFDEQTESWARAGEQIVIWPPTSGLSKYRFVHTRQPIGSIPIKISSNDVIELLCERVAKIN